MHVWRAVRCCCTPKKIFGFMLVDEHDNKITVEERGGLKKDFSIRVMNEKILSPLIDFDHLKNGKLVSNKYTREMAIYSEDHPIEYWRGCKGFVEAGEST